MRHAGPVVAEVNGLRVIECSSCGFRHLDPLPDDDERAWYYRHEYHGDGHFARVARDEDWYRARAGRLLDGLAHTSGTLLDVGCGDGLLLDVARERGYRVQGTEPSEEGSRRTSARGIAVNAGDVLGAPIGEDAFDVVVMVNVLEHVTSPGAFVSMAALLLRSGGELAVVVPRDFSLLQQQARAVHSIPPWWVVSDHANYFTSTSLHHLLVRAGFVVTHETTSFPLESAMLGGGPCYVGDPVAGRAAHEARMVFEAETDPGVLRHLYAAMALVGIGREIIIYARKP